MEILLSQKFAKLRCIILQYVGKTLLSLPKVDDTVVDELGITLPHSLPHYCCSGEDPDILLDEHYAILKSWGEPCYL